MMNRTALTLLLFFTAVFIFGCFSQIDKQKFSGIRAAAEAIDQAVEDAALSYEQFEGLLNKLNDEIARTKLSVSTVKEKELLNSYEALLTLYQDGSLLWEYKAGSSQYAWIPEGRIYVDSQVRTLVEKYHFPTEPHVVELTNHHWESISSDSIKLIWEKAHEKLKKI